jgi:hypothetical protein
VEAKGHNREKEINLSGICKSKFVLLHTIHVNERQEVLLHSFLTLALNADKWSSAGPGRFTQGQKSPVPIGPSAGLDAAEKRKLSLPYQNQTSILQSSSL